MGVAVKAECHGRSFRAVALRKPCDAGHSRCGSLRGVHTRRVARVALAGTAAVLAVAGLAGCRTSPAVAAYVGDSQVSVAALDRAVDDRLAEPGIASAIGSNKVPFTRQVLSLLVSREVYAAAADHFGVQVTDSDALQYLTARVGAGGVESEFSQDAAQGLNRADVLELVRERVVAIDIATAAGQGDALSEASLRQQYQQGGQQEQVQLGYITVPDQATADQVLAALVADPASYPQQAAAHPGGTTLAQTEARLADQIPTELAQGVAAAAPGTGFTVPVEGLGVVVGFVAGRSTPTFEAARPALEQAAEPAVVAAGQKLVDDYRDGLHVTVNPRYGVLKNQAIQPATGGVVDILSESAAAAAAAASSSSAATSGG
jgi:peptidyl-prolyl cis-trans isomerase SurA